MATPVLHAMIKFLKAKHQIKNICIYPLGYMMLLLFSSNISNAQTFIENKGQWDAPYKYILNANSQSIVIEKNKLRYVQFNDTVWSKIIAHPHGKTKERPNVLPGNQMFISFTGANDFQLSATKKTEHYYNFFLGNDESKWKSKVYGFGEIDIHNLYNGIDLKMEPLAGSLKYTYYIKKGVSPTQIKMQIEGAEKLELIKGNLHIYNTVGLVQDLAPVAWQVINDNKIPIVCKFKLTGNMISYELGDYNTNYPLVIDPVLVFSTYSGSTVDNFGFTATYDSKGSLFAGGIASSPTSVVNGRYPATSGAFQTSFGGGVSTGWENFPCDISISKYKPDGSALLWATYLGGGGSEFPHSIIADGNDQLVVFGTTTSKNFPVKTDSYDTSFNGAYDIICTKFTEDGSAIVGSTYIGGSGDDGFNSGGSLKYNYADEFRGEVDLDNDNNIYIASCTRSANFPVSKLALQKSLAGGLDGVVIKLDSTLNNIVWSTYYGGKKDDDWYSVEVTNNNKVYIGGGTNSDSLQTDSLAINPNFLGGRADGYIYCFTNDSLKFVSGTYIGNSEYNQVYFIETDRKGMVYATGQTDSVWAVSNGVFSEPNSGQFIIKIDSSLQKTILTTCFGSGIKTADLNPSAFLVDHCENVYFSGWGSEVAANGDHTGSTLNLKVSSNAIQKTTDGKDFYLIVLTKNFATRAYATYYGSSGQQFESGDHVDGGTSRFDPKGVVYQSVCSSCPETNSLSQLSNFPTTTGSYSEKNPSPRCSNASFKIDFQITNAVIADFDIGPRKTCPPLVPTITNKSTGGKYFFWDYGDGSYDTAKNPQPHTYNTPGKYIVKLVVNDSNSCNVNDTAYQTVEIYQSGKADFEAQQKRCDKKVVFKNKSTFSSRTEWNFGDGQMDTVNNPVHIYTNSGFYKVKFVINRGTPCLDSIEKTVWINADTTTHAKFTLSPKQGCAGQNVNMNNQSTPGKTYIWDFGDGSTDTNYNTSHRYNKESVFIITLTVIDSLNCNISQQVQDSINIVGTVKADFDYEFGLCELIYKFTNKSSGVLKYNWLFDSLTIDSSQISPITHTFPAPGKYKVGIIVNPGFTCTDTLYKTIDIKIGNIDSILIPNSFTPNADGINDCYHIAGIQPPCDEFHIWVYNRWGELLWQTTDINDCWHGYNDGGLPYSAGTYFYLLETNKTGKTEKKNYKGTITLIR